MEHLREQLFQTEEELTSRINGILTPLITSQNKGLYEHGHRTCFADTFERWLRVNVDKHSDRVHYYLESWKARK
jgi:hypothetical protein